VAPSLQQFREVVAVKLDMDPVHRIIAIDRSRYDVVQTAKLFEEESG
jgi:hypothetical protein